MARAALPPHLKYKKNGRWGNGKKPFQPTQQQRLLVQKMAPLLKPDEIAILIPLSLPTFYKYFKEDLQLGRAMANAVVGEMIFKQILKGNADMMKFWAARRMGWKEDKGAPLTDEEDDLAAKSIDALQAEIAELETLRRLSHAQSSEDDDSGSPYMDEPPDIDGVVIDAEAAD